MKTWVIQYVYATDKNENGVSILHVQAETIEDAKKLAIENAAAEEFVFDIYPQSDDQFLGAVKQQANMIVGKGQKIET